MSASSANRAAKTSVQASHVSSKQRSGKAAWKGSCSARTGRRCIQWKARFQAAWVFGLQSPAFGSLGEAAVQLVNGLLGAVVLLRVRAGMSVSVRSLPTSGPRKAFQFPPSTTSASEPGLSALGLAMLNSYDPSFRLTFLYELDPVFNQPCVRRRNVC